MAEATPNPTPLGTPPEDLNVSVPESWREAKAKPNKAGPESRRVVKSKLNTPAQRIALIEDSQRCLTCGWLSLIPLCGIFYLPAVFRLFRRVEEQQPTWNPAQHLLLRGLMLACGGYLTSLFCWGLFILWLGTVTNLILLTDMNSDELKTALGYILLIVSPPALIGVGVAVSRSESFLGTLILRFRWPLLILLVISYVILLLIIPIKVWWVGQTESHSEASAYRSAIILALFIIAGGFACLASLKAKARWAWIITLVWFLFAMLLISRMIQD